MRSLPISNIDDNLSFGIEGLPSALLFVKRDHQAADGTSIPPRPALQTRVSDLPLFDGDHSVTL
jgi:hypothetical protein